MFLTRRSASKKVKDMKPLVACALFALEDPMPKTITPTYEDDESILSSPRSPMTPKVTSLYADFGELVKPTPFKIFSSKSSSTLSTTGLGSRISPTSRNSYDSIGSPHSLSGIDGRKKSVESDGSSPKKSILKTGSKSRFSREQSDRSLQGRKVSLQCDTYKSFPLIGEINV